MLLPRRRWLGGTDRADKTIYRGVMIMFAFDRSAIAVLAPLALLVAAVLWSNLRDGSGGMQAAVLDDQGQELDRNQTVAATLSSR